jgi:hypothetical protein
MPKISRNSRDKFNQSCSTHHQESSKIEFAFFLISLQFSRDFTRICKILLLLKFPFCNGVPRSFPTFTNIPLDCTVNPGKIWGLAMLPLAMGGGAAPANSGEPAALPAREVVELDPKLT